MVHHGLAGDREERLGHVQRQRPEPRPFGGAADHDDGNDALLVTGHGCSASALVAECGGGRDARGRRRGDGIWRRAWTASILAEAKAMPIRRRRRW